jgi:hypothetical protein
VYTWSGAVTTKIAALNTAKFAGYSDWRLPNIRELNSIVNYETPYPGPVLSTLFDTACNQGCTVLTCSCSRADNYWSSTSDAGNPFYTWAVSFSNGSVNDLLKTYSFYVRAVRGGS